MPGNVGRETCWMEINERSHMKSSVSIAPATSMFVLQSTVAICEDKGMC